jgi:cytochrome c oxidase subunit II
MGESGSFWLPDAMSSLAPEVDSLFYFVTWASTVIFIAVIAAMIYFMIRYRRRSEADVPIPEPESRVLEVTWIVLPTILTMIVFTWGFKVFVKLNTAPPDSYQVTVRALQWSWEFEYANGASSMNDLYVPFGQPVKLTMTSDDVIHSFFVPDFRIKQDVLPNRYTSVWFEATEPGEYQVYCTEYCGTQHSGMLATIHVVSQNEFDTWMASQNQDLPPVELGEQVFAQCAVCHSTAGIRIVGPHLNGIFGEERTFDDGTSGIIDEDYLHESIVTPSAKVVATYPPAMPATYGSTLSPKEITGLIAYIKSLK